MGMSRAKRARIARYAQVRALKELQRHDDTAIDFNTRIFRKVLSKTVEIVVWNYEVSYSSSIPLWFDACVLIGLERGKKRMCFIDRQIHTTADRYSKIRARRKQEYAAGQGIPYLVVSHADTQEQVMMFKLRVQAGLL